MGIRSIGEPTSGKWIERWSVESSTSAGTEYTVAVDSAGNFGCSCPAWTFQRKRLLEKNPNWQCKHIKAVQSARVTEVRTEQKVVVGSVSVRMIDLNDLD